MKSVRATKAVLSYAQVTTIIELFKSYGKVFHIPPVPKQGKASIRVSIYSSPELRSVGRIGTDWEPILNPNLYGYDEFFAACKEELELLAKLGNNPENYLHLDKQNTVAKIRLNRTSKTPEEKQAFIASFTELASTSKGIKMKVNSEYTPLSEAHEKMAQEMIGHRNVVLKKDINYPAWCVTGLILTYIGIMSATVIAANSTKPDADDCLANIELSTETLSPPVITAQTRTKHGYDTYEYEYTYYSNGVQVFTGTGKCYYDDDAWDKLQLAKAKEQS